MTYKYIFQGTLPYNTPTYVRRQADEELFQRLKEREFCYIFNSRQMGKSSLRVRVMHRLKQCNYACSNIDLSIDETSIASNQWYFGILDNIVEDLGLNLQLDYWWNQQSSLSPLKKISKFIDEILLVEIPTNIVIFIDEIDSVLSLKFSTNDFFAFIRACYNRRADRDRSQYNRLTFCLLGVATPSTLIADKQRTPFNIGHALELTGFTFEEAKQGLLKGLKDSINNSERVLKDILWWTGGQPFLTQKVCQLVVEQENENPNLNNLVSTKIIESWKSQDDPQHLRTIEERIKDNCFLVEKMLTIYQSILQGDDVKINNSYEQKQLLLSGLVVKEQNKLKIYNPIYKKVFNEDWVAKQLETVRDVKTLRAKLNRLGRELIKRGRKFRGNEALEIASFTSEFQSYDVEKVMLLNQISIAYLELENFQSAAAGIEFTIKYLVSSEAFQKIEIETANHELCNDTNLNAIQKRQTLVRVYYTEGSLCQKQDRREDALQAYSKAFRILRNTLENKILNQKILPLEIVESVHNNLIELIEPFNDKKNLDFTTNEIGLSLIKYLKCHYAPIEKLLEDKKWRKADEETYRMLAQKVGKERIQMLMSIDFEQFPQEHLDVVSALWEKYSNGKFGFRKQAEIWLKSGGERENKRLAPIIEFWQAVGWISEGELPEIELNEINYQLQEETPNGHLPTTGLRFQEVSLFSRFANNCDTCLLI